MIKFIQKFLFLIEPKFKYRIFFLTFIILILATFETLSIGAIIPFIYSILSDKNIFLPQSQEPKLPALQNGTPVGGALLKKSSPSLVEPLRSP
jgi:hypothetical protein